MHHFCHDLPVLLVGCKKDLRNDPATIEELRKNSQRPVAFEEVFSGGRDDVGCFLGLSILRHLSFMIGS